MTDFETIRRGYPISHVAASLLGVVWDQTKSKPGDMYACCPLHKERTPSFHVEDAKGLFYCHGCGEGGDVIKLVELSHQVGPAEAARIITGEVRDAPTHQEPAQPVADPYKGYKCHPAPADAPVILAGKRTPPLRNPKRTDGKATHYTPEDAYPYYNADGDLLGYVLRVVIDGKKLTPQIWWMTGPDGFEGWSHGSLPGLRPLDGLRDLLAAPEKQVLVVEGEKCRKAAAEALRGRVVVVSWMGGTKAIAKTDFSPLKGRSIILWPDNDTGGKVAMAHVASVADASKIKRVKAYGEAGGDVADLIADGGDVAAYIKANISDWKETENGQSEEHVIGTTFVRSGNRLGVDHDASVDGSNSSKIKETENGMVSDSVPSRGDSVSVGSAGQVPVDGRGPDDNAGNRHREPRGRGGVDGTEHNDNRANGSADYADGEAGEGSRGAGGAEAPSGAREVHEQAIRSSDGEGTGSADDDLPGGVEDGQLVEANDHNDHHDELNSGVRGPRDEQSDRPSGDDLGNDVPESDGRGLAPLRDPILAVPDEEWETRLIRTDAGSCAKKSPQNAMLHIQFHDDFKGIFAYNAFNHKIMLMRRPPWQPGSAKWTPRVMDEDDETALQGQLEYCGLAIGINDLSRCVSRVARFNMFNPVRDKLMSFKWDGVKRLSGEGQRYPWLVRYFGAEPTRINDVFGRKWFISACARIMRPGCQVDTVLIVEGGQGAMKSTSFREICSPFGDSYFLDNLADPYSKDGKMAVQGKLIVELAELEAFRRSEESQKKSWITTRTDEFRPPFARQVREYPRTFVIVGTENPTGTGYLKDSTGARRYWPVMSNEIDFGMLRDDVEQLWAEAYVAYQDGEEWWLTKEEEALAAVEQRKRFKHDPWLPTITRALTGEWETNPVKLMGALDIPKKDRTATTNDRIVSILCMMQWVPVVKDGETHYHRPQ